MAAGFMTHVTCRLTAKNRDQLRNPTLGNRVLATFTFSCATDIACSFVLRPSTGLVTTSSGEARAM